MRDTDIREGLERLTHPPGNTRPAEALWGDLVDRRRKRRNRNRAMATLPLLLVAVLGVGIVSARGSDDPRSDVAAGGTETASPVRVDGSWRIVATTEGGQRQPSAGTAELTISGDHVQGEDGCKNRIDSTVTNNVIEPVRLSTQAGCSDDAGEKEADLFWNALGHRLEIRGGELWLVNDRGDGLIFERVGAADEVATGNLRVRNIKVVGNGPIDGGTEGVAIVFNEPLRVDHAQFVADISSVDPASGMVWTTQGPDSVRVCDSVHSVPEGGVGSVDLLVPVSWFADETAHDGPELETVDNPAKFLACGPHNGFIQYAAWAPVSADPVDVTVTVSQDRTRIDIKIAPADASDQAQEVEYQDITFAVPSRLAVFEPDAYEFQCLTSDDPGVYLAPTTEPLVAASCPVTLEYAESIHVQPAGSQSAGNRTVEGQGRDERWVDSTPANSWYEVVLPSYGVMFTFYEIDAATREAVLASVRDN